MTSALERSRTLQRYAESRNGITAEHIRHMKQHDFDLLYGDPEHPQPPPLFSFAEMEEPLPGWTLDRVTRVKAAGQTDTHYDVVFIRNADGSTVGAVRNGFDLAFIDARAATIVFNDRNPVAPKD